MSLENHKIQLCAELSEDFCSLVEISGDVLTFLGQIRFEEKKDFQIKERLLDFFKEKVSDFNKYEDFTVSWITPRALLVPATIFDIKEIKSLFSVCFSTQNASTELDYNRLSELSMVNIYEIPLWLKSFFVSRYPRVIIQHEYSINLRGIMKAAFKLNVNVQLYPQLMTINIVQKNELLYCNAFEIQHENDVLYYLAFVLQQLDLNNQAGNLNFHLSKLSNIQANDLESNLKKNQSFKDLDLKFNSEKIIKYHTFCV